MDDETTKLLGKVRFIERDGKFKLVNRELHRREEKKSPLRFPKTAC